MTGAAEASSRPGAGPAAGWTAQAAGWLRVGRGGMFLLALLIGVGSGLGAVAFRYLIYFFTWLATGHGEFGQQGCVVSAHLPWLGLAFFVVIPVDRRAAVRPDDLPVRARGPRPRGARGDDRGRGPWRADPPAGQRGQGGGVSGMHRGRRLGRPGGPDRPDRLGAGLQPRPVDPDARERLRILVACGAGGRHRRHLQRPVTGVFFGVEIILREFSVDALFTVMLAAMIADITASRSWAATRSCPASRPASCCTTWNYLLVAGLAVIAGLMGLVFKSVLYQTEDLCDRMWQGRPEWARPAVGGLVLGLLLLALPQVYGVGYPAMNRATAGQYALWFLIVLAFAKIAACSLTIGIGGSGGIFAPSLFVGVTTGMAFGSVVHHIFGASAGDPALYAVVAMGAVFASAARAPLTSLASVVELTGDFALTLPVMLAVAIAATISRAASYGTIYTTKLLRRGTDIDRATPWRALSDLKVADAMRPFRPPHCRYRPTPTAAPHRTGQPSPGWSATRATRRPCSLLSPSPRPCGSWRSTAVRAFPSCPPTAAKSRAGSPHPACCAPLPTRSAALKPRPRRLRLPRTGNTPTRSPSCATRPLRCPGISSSRSASPPIHLAPAGD